MRGDGGGEGQVEGLDVNEALGGKEIYIREDASVWVVASLG